MRTFISIDMPEDIRRKIKKIQDKLPEFKGKKTEPENLHLTLKFLGEIEEEKIEKTKEKLGKIKHDSFETEIDSIGVFSEKFIRIVWLHLSNCQKLQRKIDEILSEIFEKERRFMSHLTIARIKHISNKNEFLEELKKIEIPKIRFQINNFYLMESKLTPEGPKYSVLEQYELK